VRSEEEFEIEIRDPRILDQSSSGADESGKQNLDLAAQAFALGPWPAPIADSA
jgi:hypothetical protein